MQFYFFLKNDQPSNPIFKNERLQSVFIHFTLFYPFYRFAPFTLSLRLVHLYVDRSITASFYIALSPQHTHTHTQSTHTQRPVSLSSLSLFLFHFILSLDLSTSFQMHALELLPPYPLRLPFHPSSTTALSSRGSRNLNFE